MTELKWTLFKDKLPNRTSVYGTDFKGAWIMTDIQASWESYSKHYPDVAWAEIPIPEVPKKERHFCESSDGSIECIEREEGLRMNVKIRGAEWMQSNFPVKFCPFCSYSCNKED